MFSLWFFNIVNEDLIHMNEDFIHMNEIYNIIMSNIWIIYNIDNCLYYGLSSYNKMLLRNLFRTNFASNQISMQTYLRYQYCFREKFASKQISKQTYLRYQYCFREKVASNTISKQL